MDNKWTIRGLKRPKKTQTAAWRRTSVDVKHVFMSRRDKTWTILFFVSLSSPPCLFSLDALHTSTHHTALSSLPVRPVPPPSYFSLWSCQQNGCLLNGPLSVARWLAYHQGLLSAQTSHAHTQIHSNTGGFMEGYLSLPPHPHSHTQINKPISLPSFGHRQIYEHEQRLQTHLLALKK